MASCFFDQFFIHIFWKTAYPQDYSLYIDRIEAIWKWPPHWFSVLKHVLSSCPWVTYFMAVYIRALSKYGKIKKWYCKFVKLLIINCHSACVLQLIYPSTWWLNTTKYFIPSLGKIFSDSTCSLFTVHLASSCISLTPSHKNKYNIEIQFKVLHY